MYRRLIWVSSVQKRVPRVRIRSITETSTSSSCCYSSRRDKDRSSRSFLTETCNTGTNTGTGTDQLQRHYQSSDRCNNPSLWPVSSNLLPIHPRSLGGGGHTSTSTSTAATNNNIKARYFSTSLDANGNSNANGNGNANAKANAAPDTGSTASLNASRRRAALRKRRKVRQFKQQTRSSNNNNKKKHKHTAILQRQTALERHAPESFETLFDQIAPSNSLVKLMELVSQLQNKIKQDTNSYKAGNSNKAGKAGNSHSNKAGNSNSNSSTLPLVTVLLGMLQSTNHNNTMQITVLEFLLSTTFFKQDGGSGDKQQQVTDEYEYESVLTETNAIAVLTAARVCALEQALGWNRLDIEAVAKEPTVMKERKALHAAKTEDELREQARQLSVTLVESLPARKFRVVINILEAYANAHGTEALTGGTGTASTSVSASASASLSGSESAVSDESDFEDASSSEETEEVVGTAAAATATTGSGTGTGTAATKTTSKKRKGSIRKLRFELERIMGAQFHLVAADTADFFYMNVGLNYNVVATTNRIPFLAEKWQEAKEKFVHVMMDVQEKLLASIEDVDDAEVQVVDDPKHANSEQDGGIIDEKTLVLLSPSKKKKKDDRRFSRPAHVVFEAMALHEAAAAEEFDDSFEDGMSSSSVIAPLKSKQIAFVDNLPVDITKDELAELYARCGKLESVEIFNQRPELDPGSLNRKERAERRKKNLQSGNAQFRKWQRPRTPIYGMLTFESHEGCKSAVNDSLRIFGMMVRKHPVRSIRSSDMTRIYLEGISDNQPSVDLEYQLSKQLHPDLFVCLDAGQNNRSIVGSCEIKFPSFEAALESYQKLTELGLVNNEDSTCTLNWLRTPKDAEQWWTRKLGFE